MESYAQARAVNSGDISVGQAPYIIYTQAFQKVVDAGADFHVRTAMHRSGKRFGREKQQGMLSANIFFPYFIGRIVFGSQPPEPSAEGNHLAQFQFLQQRNIVE